MGIDVVEDEDEAKLTLTIHGHHAKLLLWIFRSAKEAKLPRISMKLLHFKVKHICNSATVVGQEIVEARRVVLRLLSNNRPPILFFQDQLRGQGLRRTQFRPFYFKDLIIKELHGRTIVRTRDIYGYRKIFFAQGHHHTPLAVFGDREALLDFKI